MEENKEPVKNEQNEEIDSAVESNTKKREEGLKNFEGRTVEKPKKSKYSWVGNILLLVAIGLGVWAMFGIGGEMGETKSIGEIIAGSDWRFALVLLAVFVIIVSCDCLKYNIILKTTTGKFSAGTGIKLELLGRFYDNVTPFAVGGQPMQIYYLHKKGYSGGVSSAVVLIKYFTQMFCMCTLSLIFMAFNTGALNEIGDSAWRTVITVGAWIGLTVNLSLPIMVVLFALLPKFSHKIASFVINIGYKIKLVKDKDATMGKADKLVDDFRASIRIMSHKPFNFIALILLCITEVLLRFAMPYFVMKMFPAFPEGRGGFSDLIFVMALNVYATQSVAIIPTPGNSGAIESTGTLAFSAIAAGSVLAWSVFTWRFLIFYIYIIVGLLMVAFDFIKGLVKIKSKPSGGASGKNADD